MPSGRFFGFVLGGSFPTAVAADWLTSAWDQNAGLALPAPSAGVVEEVAGSWLKELFGLPEASSFGFVTGCQTAHFTCLAAARHHLLAEVGWDVEREGLNGAPPIRVVAGANRHATVDRALRFLGMGTAAIDEVPADGNGRMLMDALQATLAPGGGPTIVCVQAGEINTGAFDDFQAAADACAASGAWLHIDGAFGLWAAASPSLRHLTAGAELADSWATDAHKWLNVPYDSGLAFCAHPASHQAALGVRAAYLLHADAATARDAIDFNPEHSRRARAFPIYATLRSLGRTGVAELIERTCARASVLAEGLAELPGCEVLNEVVLNPGTDPIRRRRAYGRRPFRRAAERRGLDERHDLERPKDHPLVGLELADERRRCSAHDRRVRRGPRKRFTAAEPSPPRVTSMGSLLQR